MNIPKSNEVYTIWIGDIWKNVPENTRNEIMNQMIEQACRFSSEDTEEEFVRISFVQLNETDLRGSDGCVCIRSKRNSGTDPTDKQNPARERVYHFRIKETMVPQIIPDYISSL